MKTKTTLDVHILVGLPGSGKTTFGKKLMQSIEESNKKNYGRNRDQCRVKYIDCDDSMYRNQPIECEIKHLCDSFLYHFYDEKYVVIIDGLFLTQLSLRTVVKSVICDVFSFSTTIRYS